MRRLVALSSTTSARRPASSTRGASSRGGSGRSCSCAVNQKVEPLPSSLSTPIDPPSSSQSLRLIASPSPVPPYLRVVEASACVND